MVRKLSSALGLLRRYPSALAGLAVIAALVATAGYTVLAIPYGRALSLWRETEHWREYPVNARPLWSDWLTRRRLARTMSADSRRAETRDTPFSGGLHRRFFLEIDYRYDDFPSELAVFLEPSYERQPPFIRFTWHAPDGRATGLGGRRADRREKVSFSNDRDLERRLGAPPEQALFAGGPDAASPAPLAGTHRLEVEIILFEPGADLAARLVAYGRVHGAAGTDHQRRSLMVALLWGVPLALAFGLLAALGTTMTTLLVAAAGAWFGGWFDALIQRLTEVNMILPLLPILVMIGTLYSTSIWVMLGVVILLGIFSAGIKMYRAMLLPLREAPYVEAARASGAGSGRIITRYMIPRVLPVLIPGFVTLVPSFVFLEASLALLGLGDPVLPTWGKILNDAQAQSALYNGHYYWVVQPAILLMVSGLGFAMLGFALDRIFNPRLRQR